MTPRKSLSPKHEAFAQGVASGKSATAAYIEAGYSPNGADGAACKLQGNASVASRIEELRAENQKSMSMTRLDWVNAIQERAMSLPPELPAAARYFDMIAKAQGWYAPDKLIQQVSESSLVVTPEMLRELQEGYKELQTGLQSEG